MSAEVAATKVAIAVASDKRGHSFQKVEMQSFFCYT